MASELSSDGFKLVTSSRKGKKNKAKTFQRRSSFNIDKSLNTCTIDKDSGLRRITLAQENLVISEYYKSFISSLSDSLANYSKITSILCFGLGHICECTISRHQLALLLNIKRHFQITQTFVHDPIFYDVECAILEELGCKVIPQNEEGKRELQSESFTLVYLPHCPKQLLNNFLWKNWSPVLKKCLLICNSFNGTIESNPTSVLKVEAAYILNIFPVVKEIKLVNNFKYSDIFNDTSIHIFQENNIDLLPAQFWLDHTEPQYTTDTELITADLFSALNINN